MFIPRDTRRTRCEHCIVCRWCHARMLRSEAFRMKDGPQDFHFCDTECSNKWLKHRHVIGLAQIVKMPAIMRTEYLRGRSIDEFVASGELKQYEYKPDKFALKFFPS